MTDYLDPTTPESYREPGTPAQVTEYGCATCNDCFEKMDACLIIDLSKTVLIPRDCVRCGSQDLAFEAGEA